MKNDLRQNKGITLIALVITIIVLLILAGVSIATLTGENGILTQANNAKGKTAEAEAEEIFKLVANEWQIEKRKVDAQPLKEFLEAKIPNELDKVTDNGDGTYTIEYKGETSVISDNGDISDMTYTQLDNYRHKTSLGEIEAHDTVVPGEVCSKCNCKILEAGLYTEDNILIAKWNELGINVEKDYNITSSKSETTSPYYVFTTSKVANGKDLSNGTKLIVANEISKIGEYAFYYTKLKEITLPNSVATIGEDSFAASSIKTFVTPLALTNITHRAFIASSITNVEISKNVTTIEGDAFTNCYRLTEITIPDTVTNIAGSAFQYCNNLKTINYNGPATGKPWGADEIDSGIF